MYQGTGDQCGYTNMVTRLPARQLLEGYRKVIATIYRPHEYFRRSLDALCRLPHPEGLLPRVQRVLAQQRINGTFILRQFRATKTMQGRWGMLGRNATNLGVHGHDSVARTV